MELRQILDVFNQGVVIFDKTYRVLEWNRWMEDHSRISRNEIVGKNIYLFFPYLKTPSFLRNCKSVFAFGNIAFLSQAIHSHLFKFKPKGSHSYHFDYMQQSAVIAPLKNDDNEVESCIITIQDVTESVLVERKLQALNMIDPLTNAFNRRLLDLRLADEFARYKRYTYSFSVIMIDIDNFKMINDTYGHNFGDIVLVELVKRIQNILRDTDIITRYGGEEFCCILPETDLHGGKPVAERTRSLIADKPFSNGKIRINVTISLGFAEMFSEVDTPAGLLDLADQALYAAKREGKNRVICYDHAIKRE